MRGPSLSPPHAVRHSLPRAVRHSLPRAVRPISHYCHPAGGARFGFASHLPGVHRNFPQIIGGGLNSPVAEWLNKGLMCVWSPTWRSSVAGSRDWYSP
eukprot:5152628-Pyramimonas_sp.AAC.1